MRVFARSFALTFIAVVFVLTFTAPAVAQDFATNTQPAPLAAFAQAFAEEPPVTEAGEGVVEEAPIDLDQNATEAGVSIIETVTRFLHKFMVENPVFSVLTALIVGVLKFLPGIKPNAEGKGGVHSNVLAFAVAALLWLTYTGASLAGYAGQYTSIASRIADFAPYILGFLATLFGAQIVHEQSAKRSIPVLGSKRPVVQTPKAPTPGIASIAPVIATVQSEGTTISWIPDVSDEDRRAA